jgi:tetratricopeptide (TPR) repeat protein
MGIGVHGAGWLLRLTNTNAADVDLVSAFYEKYENYDWVVRNLTREGSSLSPEMAKRLLRSSFVRGDMAQFGVLWKQYESSVGSDKAMQVYFNAWRSGWGLPRESREGRALLEVYLQDPERRLLAHQLRLPVAYAQADLKGYEESLRFLHEQNVDRINQQVDYWRLLDHVHRKEDAIRAAKEFVVPPSTPLETINMATTFAELGLDDDAIKLLEKGTRDFPWNPDLWSLLGSTLAKHKRWDDLRTLALNLRVDPVARESVGGLAYYLEGLAHWNTHHEALAVAAFEKVPTQPFDSPLRAFTTAMALNRLGQSGPATLLLKQAEGAFTNTASFYFELTVASFQARQSEALLQAAEKAYQLNPNNLGYANNFAAALICTRQRSAEALQLTFRLLNVSPNNPAAMINHALALCQNARYAEAADLLNGINQSQLLPEAVNALQLALFEIHIGQGHYAEARRVHDLIVPNLLFPNQAQWVREALSRLPTNKG